MVSFLPPFLRYSTTNGKCLLRNDNPLLCLVSAIVKNSQQEAAQLCVNQTVSSALTPSALARVCRGPPSIARSPKAFPAQLKISTNGAGWRESDINRWIADPAGWRQRSRNEFDFLDDY